MTLAIAGYYEAWWIQIIKALLIFGVALGILPLIIVYERKLLGRFQGRYGPNRVGPYGLLQPLAEIIKFATKEDIRPVTSVGPLYYAAPIISIICAVAAFALVPFGDAPHIFGTRVGLYGVDTSVGPLYVFAFGAIAFYGLMLGGWASGSKYSFLGAMRAAAQLISYEVSQGLALLGVIITAGSLSLTAIVHGQGGMWYFIPQAVGFLVFTVAGFAETNRSPFDLIEADAELVGGYFTEYGGTRMVAFLFAEYLNMLVVSGIAVTLFLGGWLLPFGIHPRLGRPLHRAREDDDLRDLLHLDPRDAAAPALRPADELRLEGAAATGHAQHARDRDHRRGGAQVSVWVHHPPGIGAPPPAPPPPPRGSWSPGDDQIAVQRAPAPGAAGGAYRAFGETLRGLKTTFARVVEGVHTIQYPEEKVPVYPRFRGRHRLHRFEDTGLEKCVGCSLCAAACPADCIRVVAAENTPTDRVSAGERYAAVYEINMSRCIFSATASWPARSTRSRWATTSSSPTTTARI